MGPATATINLLPGCATVGSPHRRCPEPTGPPPALRCLTIGVQYDYEKDSENTRLRCCEKVLIELDQWSSSFVWIRFGSVLIGLGISRVDAFHLFNLMD
jgi:hypothetical protein